MDQLRELREAEAHEALDAEVVGGPHEALHLGEKD